MEPTGVLGAIGFSISQISFILITLPQLHQIKKRYNDCRVQLEDYMLSLEKSQSKYRNWEIVWRRFDTTAYQSIWAEKYADIQRARQRILDLSQGIEKKIQDIVGDPEAPPSRWQRWKKAFSLKSEEGPSPWSRVLFALSDNVTIKEDIGKLKTAIEDITELCQGEFSKRIGIIRTAALTLEDTEKLFRLLSFFSPFTQRAKNLFEARGTGQISRRTQGWMLELGSHVGTKNIGDWEYWDPVVVRFAFNALPTGPDANIMSLCVVHDRDLHDEPIPADFPSIDWQRVICGDDIPIEGVTKERWPTSQPCLSFGRMFRDGTFEDKATLMSWKPYRAELILSLTSWVFLLWDTPWTAELCSLGLRSVCDGPVQTLENDLSVRLSTLGTDFQHRTDCNHSNDNKLLSFGILLAELFTTTPIRQAPRTGGNIPIRYEKWNRKMDDWQQISARELVNMVREKSGSADMRDVVKFCIDEANVRTPRFEAGYILEYINKLYEPIEKWCQDELEAHQLSDYEELDAKHWKNAALENPGSAQDITSLQTNINGRATRGVVGICVLLFAFTAAASMWM